MKTKNIAIGVITINSINYGNRLQNYALINYLSEYGEVKNIVREIGCMNELDGIIPEKPLKRISKKTYLFIKKVAKFFVKHKDYVLEKERNKNFYYFNEFIPMGEKLSPKTNFDALVSTYDYFVTGSDQVWNPNFSGNGMFVNMLGFAPAQKKIAGCPSISVDELTENQKKEFKKYLSDFKALSCREQQGADLITEITGRECTGLIDPTLMLSAEDWDLVSRKPKWHDENRKYILMYFLGNITNEYEQIIEVISQKYHLEIINMYDRKNVYYSCGPSEFIWMIKHCSIMLTDSFHGLVFSYIYNRPVRLFKRKDSFMSMNSRMTNLINKLHLDNTIFIDEDFSIDNVFDVNYEKSFLVSEQQRFIKYFKESFRK